MVSVFLLTKMLHFLKLSTMPKNLPSGSLKLQLFLKELKLKSFSHNIWCQIKLEFVLQLIEIWEGGLTNFFLSIHKLVVVLSGDFVYILCRRGTCIGI